MNDASLDDSEKEFLAQQGVSEDLVIEVVAVEALFFFSFFCSCA